MPNIFASMETGKNSLITNQIGMDTTGHNIANLHTEGYSRQRALQVTMYPDDIQPGQIGRGVRVKRVLRVYNQFIENLLRKEKTGQAEWSLIYDSQTLVEVAINEPGESGLQNKTAEFFNSWQNLSDYPEDYGIRSLVRTAGEDFSGSFNQLKFDYDNLRTETDQKVTTSVYRINEILEDIADLNTRILSVEVAGNDPNDLKDTRDNLTAELSKYIDIDITQTASSLQIMFGNYLLVEGDVTNLFATQQNALNDSMLDVTFGGAVINFNNFSDNRKGELGGLIKFRDNILPDYKSRTTEYVTYIAHNVNDAHYDGYSYNGTTTGLNFFTVTDTTTPQNYADLRVFSTKTGVIRVDAMTSIETGSHHIAIAATMGAGGASTLTGGGATTLNQTGTFTGSADLTTDYYLEIVTANTIAGDLAGLQVQLMKSGTAVGSVVTVPAGAAAAGVNVGTVDGISFTADFNVGVAQYVVSERTAGYAPGNFTASLDGNAPQAIAFNSNVTLTGGTNSGFTAGGTMETIFGATLTVGNETVTAYTNNSEFGIVRDILDDVNNIAAAANANSAGDNSNALNIINLQFQSLMQGSSQTFGQFYNELTTSIGSDTENAFKWKENQDSIVDQLTEQREAISGVNLDEELTFMLKYQRGFESASRFVTTIDGMIDVIINRMGYVGR